MTLADKGIALKVAHVRADHFKRLTLVDVSTNKDVVTVGGKNAQGKSSLLDAIWATLANKGAAVDRPVKDGAARAETEVELRAEDGTGLIVTRTYKPDGGSTLTVKVKDSGAKVNRPQTYLDEIVGKFAFDPLEFAEQDAKKQLATLLGLVKLDFDLPTLEAGIREARETRTEVGREVKRLQGVVDSTPRPDDEVPEQPLVISELLAEREKAASAQAYLVDLRRQRDQAKAHIAELERQLEVAKKDMAQIRQLGKEAAAAAAGHRDVETIDAEINAAEQINAAVAEGQRFREAVAQLTSTKGDYEAWTTKIKELEDEKTAGLARANFPIEGLSFDEDGVLYQGVPFSQASQAERIRVSVAMAMAMNPTLRVILVKDASLLDEDNQQLLRDIAAEHGFQLFLEMVGTGGHTLQIVDGEVAK